MLYCSFGICYDMENEKTTEKRDNVAEDYRSKKSVPKFVGVYTRILQMIQDGIYDEGSKIPSEPELAKLMGVSRMTLRQALALLQEDGVIETIHGQGNFVRKSLSDKREGLEKRGNPLYKSINGEVDRVDTQYRLDVSDSYTNMVFRRETAVFIGIKRRYYIKDMCVGFSFSYIPSDIEELQTVNLGEEKVLDHFLDEIIYEKSHVVNLEIQAVSATKEFMEEVPFEENVEYTYLIKESIINAAGDVLVYTKYSIPLSLAKFEVNQYH